MSDINVDEFLKNSEKTEKELDENNNQISLNELFNALFMGKYTNFSSFDELINASNFVVNSDEDFENIPDADMDNYIKQSTKFSSWEEMLTTASEEYYLKKLGF